MSGWFELRVTNCASFQVCKFNIALVSNDMFWSTKGLQSARVRSDDKHCDKIFCICKPTKMLKNKISDASQRKSI